MILKVWLNHKTNKAQKANLNLRKSVAYRESQSMGIIFHNNEQSKIESAEKLSTLLKMDSKKVKILAYERNNTVKHLPYDSVTNENFGFWGSYIGKPITDFVNTKFDFLICLDEQPNAMVKSILANSKARCRVGWFDENNQPLFEMLLENTTEKKDWVDSIYQYLKILS